MINKILEKFIFESQNYTSRDLNGNFVMIGIYRDNEIYPLKYNDQFYIIYKNTYDIKNEIADTEMRSYFIILFSAEFNNCILFDKTLKNKLNITDYKDLNANTVNSMGIDKIYDEKRIFYFTENTLSIKNAEYYFVENGTVKHKFNDQEKYKKIKEIYG